MHIVVCMKQIPDLEKIRIKADTREPVLEGLPVLFGDFDKCAIEEAVRIKEKQADVKVTAVAVGSAKLKDTIKEALAIGADEAVILTDAAFAGLRRGGHGPDAGQGGGQDGRVRPDPDGRGLDRRPHRPGALPAGGAARPAPGHLRP